MGTPIAHRVPGRVKHRHATAQPARIDGGTVRHPHISRGVHASGGALAIPVANEAATKADHSREYSTANDSNTLSKVSDAELIQEFVKSRDERAFAELYKRHKADIYTYCVRMMSGDRDKASDIFQDVFIKAFERADQFRIGSNVGGWLYTIARNQCLNTHRNQHPAERIDAENSPLRLLASTDRSLAPEYDEEQHSLRQKLEAALAQLPLEFREPFILREFDGFSYAEIAEMTGMSPGMVKIRIYRAKQRMRELLRPILE